ncbi:MAG: hypothetical protein JRI45_11155 [Deltaproteobacteria bacterium]|nr:hypothetical protein [Deltaproteobacteria bacterium]MBW2068469.1 hypothetical protein [Deltaproteobacteria bacterium]
MNGILEKVQSIGNSLMLYARQCAFIAMHWGIKLAKIQRQKAMQKVAERKLAKAYSEFGKVVYGLYKEGKAEWQDVPEVREKLDGVKLAEANVEQFDQIIEEINKQYEDKKQELKEKYAAMRNQTGKEGVAEQEHAGPDDNLTQQEQAQKTEEHQGEQ